MHRVSKATVDALAGPGEPKALSYWAVSDVFEESFFPVHNESFHGMFGLINLHGIPKPSYRAYQLLHETGEERLNVRRTDSASADVVFREREMVLFLYIFFPVARRGGVVAVLTCLR